MRVFQEDRASHFIDQSTHDVPCRVRFASNDSLMSLSRWGGEASLVFAPGREHAGETREQGNELLLKSDATPKQYHVFRRLDGERFEYDVVLLKEPETNIIEIELEFPDGLEFFRQPSAERLIASPFRCSPEVMESYAVYWKERNGPYKTGKFCHIYRPEIRDARGWKVWGQLDITGNMMRITIPEEWLSDAAYPVVVDPIVGTQTRGALNMIDWNNEGVLDEFYLELKMGFSRFTAATPISGVCTSYLYAYRNIASSGCAVLYSDVGGNPTARLSRDEQVVSLQRSTPSWVASTFTLPSTVAQGASFWYGYFTSEMFYTYYDAVGTFRRMATDEYESPPDLYDDEWNERTWQVLMSAYFSYSSALTVNRLVMDTIGLTELRTRSVGVRRVFPAAMALLDMSLMTRFLMYRRVIADTVESLGQCGFLQVLFRFCVSNFSGTGLLKRSVTFIRLVQGAFTFFERLLPRMILKKEELSIVSRVTREIEVKGDLL